MQDLRNPPKLAHSAQKHTDYPHLPTQSDPYSQTARPQVRNTASGCNAARSLHHNTGFAVFGVVKDLR